MKHGIYYAYWEQQWQAGTFLGHFHTGECNRRWAGRLAPTSKSGVTSATGRMSPGWMQTHVRRLSSQGICWIFEESVHLQFM